MHKKPGYILFLLFGILTLAMTMITLFMARSNSYQQLMHLLVRKETTSQLALSSTALGQSLLYLDPNKDKKEAQPEPKDKNAKGQQAPQSQYDQELLTQIASQLNTTKEYKLYEEIDGIEAILRIYLAGEDGKLNINSVYDFGNKKFVKEGQEGDRKKFCEWMFKKISEKTGKPSLFEPFEQHIKNRKSAFNDVTELLQIKEFAHVFAQATFYNLEQQPTLKEKDSIYLTNLFTVSTEHENLNPWLLSYSWQILLDIKIKKNSSKEEHGKIMSQFKKEANWDKDWDKTVGLLYQKEYKDIPKEIKSVLTTDCEANIFSLLLSATIGETTSTIFTILKKQPVGKTATFDIIKVYQI